jgi:pimeloyl-ACP methyl ester carboxylesterase
MSLTIQGVDDNTLVAEEHGRGDPGVLLVHGFTGGRIDFHDVAGPLAASRRVVIYDHRGHAESGHASDYSFDRLVRDLERVVADRHLAPMHLLGHSMGGIVAQRFVLAHPEQVRSLILMDTMPAPASPNLFAMMQGVVALGREQGMEAVADLLTRLMENMPAYGTPERIVAARERLHRKVSSMDLDAFSALGRELSEFPSLVSRLHEIGCPTTVIVGEHDVGLRDAAEVFAKEIPGAELEVIAGTGHSPQEDDPEAWLDVVERHLARVGRNRP